MGCEGMTSLQLLGIQLACQIVPEPQDVQDEILTDSGHKTTTTVILEGRMSFWIGRAGDVLHSNGDSVLARHRLAGTLRQATTKQGGEGPVRHRE